MMTSSLMAVWVGLITVSACCWLLATPVAAVAADVASPVQCWCPVQFQDRAGIPADGGGGPYATPCDCAPPQVQGRLVCSMLQQREDGVFAYYAVAMAPDEETSMRAYLVQTRAVVGAK